MRWKVPLYGCTYTYDDVAVGKALVDTCGVLMRRDSERECTVKWGGDREYREPHTTSMDYGLFCNVVSPTGQ